MAATESDFTTGTSDVPGGGDLKDQWPSVSRIMGFLRALWYGSYTTGTEPNATLRGLAVGNGTLERGWRVYGESGDLEFQRNDNTDASPSWTTVGTGTGGGMKKSIQLRKTSPQNLANATPEDVTWDTADQQDSDAFTWASGVGSESVTIVDDGWYLINVYNQWAAGAFDGRVISRIVVNGSTLAALGLAADRESTTVGVLTVVEQMYCTWIQLDANDTIGLEAEQYQSTSATKDLEASTKLRILRL